jgi:hypothetical protein
MSGSTASRPGLPPLPELARRFAVVSVGMLLVGGVFATPIVKSLIPLLGRCVQALTVDFDFLAVVLDESGKQPVISFHANLSHVVAVGRGFAYPFGYGNVPDGFYEVTLTTGGVLQHALFLLIVVLAWPGTRRELLFRAVLALPLASLLILQHVSVTVLAELWGPLRDQLAPGEFSALLTWSRFLMGGGGLVMAMALGAVIIAGVARWQPRAARARAPAWAHT